MNDQSFGIDLGTSTSVISHIVRGRPCPLPDPFEDDPIVPSIVGLSADGELLAGFEALNQSLPECKIREAKRAMGSTQTFQLGNTSLLPEEVAALVLKKMKHNAETILGCVVDSAVITVPAYFDDLPRRATEKAAALAGLKLIRLISEPVAAAMAYGIERLDEEETLLVYDFGGGTLDVTIIEMMAGVLDVKTTDGDKALGGKDIDQALSDYVLDKMHRVIPFDQSASLEKLKLGVERAKKDLSDNISTRLYLPSLDDGNTLFDIDLNITRQEFDTVCLPLLKRSLEKVEGALKKAGLSKHDITKLLLVGGTCHIPCVRNTVEAFFGLTAEQGVDRDLAVSQGAAISAGLKTGAIDAQTSIVAQDVATYRMGTRSLGLVGNQLMALFSELMPQNAPIPFVRTERFQLLTVVQDEVVLEVLQDPSGQAILAQDSIPTGAQGIIKDIPASTTDEPRSVDVEFRFDENQIIRVTGKIVGVDRMVTIQLNSEAARSDPLQALGASSVVNVLWESSPLATRNMPLIRRVEFVLSGGIPQGEVIEAALERLKVAISERDEHGTQEARGRLIDLLADLS